MGLLKAKNSFTHIDNIINALQKGDLSVLSEEERRYYTMISFADDILRDYNNHGNGSRYMANMIKVKFGVSEVTAYKAINDAKYIFRSVNIIDKEYWRQVLVEMQMKLYKLFMKNPEKNAKHLNQAISNMTKLLQLDQRDPDPIPLDKLGGNKYVMVLKVNGEMKELPLNSLLTMKEEERMQILDLVEANAQEVTFEEIMPEDEQHQGD